MVFHRFEPGIGRAGLLAPGVDRSISQSGPLPYRVLRVGDWLVAPSRGTYIYYPCSGGYDLLWVCSCKEVILWGSQHACGAVQWDIPRPKADFETNCARNPLNKLLARATVGSYTTVQYRENCCTRMDPDCKYMHWLLLTRVAPVTQKKMGPRVAWLQSRNKRPGKMILLLQYTVVQHTCVLHDRGAVVAPDFL